MHQAIAGAHEVHERTEIGHVDDLAGVDLANFRFGNDADDPVAGGFDLGRIARRDLHGAIVFDVDLGAGGGDDLADHLAASADDVADLVLRHAHRFDARGMGRQTFAGAVQRLGHFAEDVRTAFLGLGQGDTHDLLGDAGDLDVHLQRRDAIRRTGHLEVHVTQVIFITQDVADHGEVFAFEDQAHGDAGARALERHTGIHQRQRTTADRGHRRRAVGLGDVGQHADRVGELFLRRQQRVQGAPCQLAVTDFAAARRAEAADFTHRIGGEVVVQHEAFIPQAIQTIDHLFRIGSAERGGDDGLGFAAGEQRRTMGAWQEAHHRFDRAHRLGVAAIDTAAFLQDRAAHDVAFKLLEQLAGLHLLLRGAVGEHGLGLVLGFGQRRLASRLARQAIGGVDVLADGLLERRQHGLVVRDGQIPRILGGLLGEADDGIDHRLDAAVREHHAVQHFLFRQLLGFGFDHHHGVAGTGDNEIERAFLDLGLGRVEHIFAVDVADARTGDRAHEGHAGQGEGGRRRDQRQDIAFGFAIIAEHMGDHVDFVVETFREQRADRTIDQAAGERFMLSGAALALEEAAGDTAGSGIFFLIVDGEREEILALLHTLGGGDGAQDNGFAQRGDHGGIGLTGNAAGFQGQRAAAPVQFFFVDRKHGLLS